MNPKALKNLYKYFFSKEFFIFLMVMPKTRSLSDFSFLILCLKSDSDATPENDLTCEKYLNFENI